MGGCACKPGKDDPTLDDEDEPEVVVGRQQPPPDNRPRLSESESEHAALLAMTNCE